MHLFRSFSENLKQDILNSLDEYLGKNSSPQYAAFDADGTLWPEDVGELFFHYQINSGKIKFPAGISPWEHYHNWKIKDPVPAYYWLAQINQGLELEDVRAMALDCLRQNNNWAIFQDQKWLIAELKKRNIKVYIVTASVKWAVEPFATLVGLTQDDVLGIETKVEKGLVTTIPHNHPTFKNGKALRFLQETGGVAPILASGNTMGDFELLKSSKLLRLAVCSAPPGQETYATEQELQRQAIENKWLQHQF